LNNKTRLFEISGAITTGLLKFVLFDIFGQKLIFIVLAISFWSGYIIYRAKRDKSIFAYWGFSRKNIRPAFIQTSLFALVSFAFIVIYGAVKSTLHYNPHITLSLVTYPFWGLIQQFLTMSLIAGNLSSLSNIKISKSIIIIITSVVFCLVHYPSPLLMGGTFILAVFYTIVFLKYKNLYPLGLYHGWIGTLFYYFVLNKDPWLRLLQFS
jgi:hypothetical protein